MSDIFTAEFEPSPSPVAADPPKKKRNRRKLRDVALTNGAAKPVKAAATPEAPKKPRKARQPRAITASVKVDLATMLAATVGMKSEDAHLFSQIVHGLHKTKKVSRKRILEAIGKVFA